MSDLWREPSEVYGPSYRDHVIEQYRLYVEMADRVSQRRAAANNYLLTVNAFLVTLYGLTGAIVDVSVRSAWAYAVPAAGVAVCYTWLAIVHSYRDINTSKFKVIHELEGRLPVALYAEEWNYAEQGGGKAYRPTSHIETLVPYIFMALYVLLAAAALA
jgi:hypothetical protein